MRHCEFREIVQRRITSRTDVRVTATIITVTIIVVAQKSRARFRARIDKKYVHNDGKQL